MLILVFSMPLAQAEDFSSRKTKKEPISAISATDLKLFIDQNDLSQDLKLRKASIQLSLDASSLLNQAGYPQALKIEFIGTKGGTETLLAIATATASKASSAKNMVFAATLDGLNSTQDVIFRIYDVDNNLVAAFRQNIQITNGASGIDALSDSACTGSFGECHIEYLLKNLKFSVYPARNPASTVSKQIDGSYVAYLPFWSRGRFKQVLNLAPVGEDDPQLSEEDGVQFFDGETLVAEMLWNPEREAVELTFPNTSNSFYRFYKTGKLSLGTEINSGYLNLKASDAKAPALVMGSGVLSTTPINGALEFDGERLYFTANSTRTAIGERGLQGPPGPAGRDLSVLGSPKQIPYIFEGRSLLGLSTLLWNQDTLQVNNAITFNSLNAANATGAVTVDWTTGNQKRITLTGNTTLSFTAPRGISNLLLEIVQDGTGSRLITWPGSVRWSQGLAPTLTTNAAATDIATCFYNGTNYLCQLTPNFL